MIKDIFQSLEDQSEQITQLQELNNQNDYKELVIEDESSATHQDIDQYCKTFYKRIIRNCQKCQDSRK